MFKYCLNCFDENTYQKIGRYDLCRECTYALSQTSVLGRKRHLYREIDNEVKSYELKTLFKYRSIVRTMILRAKVSGDQRALSFLSALLLKHPTTQSYLKGVETIIPAPSSFWGRIRGKLDIAHTLACDLKEESATTVECAPSHLFWRFQKRAKQKGRKLIVPRLDNLEEIEEETQTILIIDDVITSGHTLLETAAALKYPLDKIKLLALSDAT